MSKKMLKRSLALGALMAFVITGSAMAAERNIDLKGENITFDNVTNAYLQSGYNSNQPNPINLNGTGVETVTIDGVSKQCAIAAYGAGNITVNKVNEIVVNGEWRSTDASVDYDGNVFYAQGTKSDVAQVKFDMPDGTIRSEGTLSKAMTFHATCGGEIEVIADVVDLKTTSNAVISQAGSGYYKNSSHPDNPSYVKFDVNKIKLVSTDATTVNSFFGTNNVTIEANEEVVIHSEAYSAVKHGCKGTTLVDGGKYVELDGKQYSINASGDGSTIIVKGDTANFKGAVNVASNATVNLSGITDLVLKGLTANDENAAIQVAEGGTLIVNTAGTLGIDGAEAGNTYKVVSGVDDKSALWTDANLAYDRTALFATSDLNDMVYSVTYTTADEMTEDQKEAAAEQIVQATGGEELAVPGLVGSAAGAGSIMEDTAPGAKEFLGDIAADKEMSKETKAAVINSAAQLAEAGGNAGTAVSVAGNVSNVTTGRMSFGGRGHGGHKGGHGVGMFEEGSGAAVWAQYMHGKDDATDMPMDGGATSYESEYDGIVVGVDFKKVGKYHSGIAFNYGEGDSNGFTSAARTKSDYDFWGIGYYGNIRNEDTNFIFDVNYAKSDSDVTQNNAGAPAAIEASPETTTWSAGVKVEKLYQNESVQIIPYTGLRYMSIDTDEYTSKLGGETLFNYAPERQDIWLLPLGVTIKQEVVNDNGWVVTPKVDLSYIWAFGDTDSNMSVSIPGIAASNDTLGFTVMDDGSFLGLVGVEAKLDDWTFGVSYSYQKGDYAESKKWFVDAKYSF